MKKVFFKIIFYSLAAIFFSFIFAFTVLTTMGTLIKGKEIATPNFLNLSLKDARKKAYESDVHLKELLLNSEMSKPEVVISQFPQPGSLIKEAGNREIKIFYTPKKSEIIMPDLSGISMMESKTILKKSNLKWYHGFIYSDLVPIDYIISQTYVAGTKLKKGNMVGVLISKGKQNESFLMPEIIGKKAEDVHALFENIGINDFNISYKIYDGLEPGIIINQSPRQGYKINNRSIINLEVSE